MGGVQHAAAAEGGDVGIVEIFPFHLSPIHVGDPVGGQIGYIHFQHVLTFLQIWPDIEERKGSLLNTGVMSRTSFLRPVYRNGPSGVFA